MHRTFELKSSHRCDAGVKWWITATDVRKKKERKKRIENEHWFDHNKQSTTLQLLTGQTTAFAFLTSSSSCCLGKEKKMGGYKLGSAFDLKSGRAIMVGLLLMVGSFYLGTLFGGNAPIYVSRTSPNSSSSGISSFLAHSVS